MNPQNFFATFYVWQINRDLPIKTAGTQQRRIQHIGPVSRGNNDYTFLGVEPIHLDQERVQGLFAFIMTASNPVTAVAPAAYEKNIIQPNRKATGVPGYARLRNW